MSLSTKIKFEIDVVSPFHAKTFFEANRFSRTWAFCVEYLFFQSLRQNISNNSRQDAGIQPGTLSLTQLLIGRQFTMGGLVHLPFVTDSECSFGALLPHFAKKGHDCSLLLNICPFMRTKNNIHRKRNDRSRKHCQYNFTKRNRLGKSQSHPCRIRGTKT